MSTYDTREPSDEERFDAFLALFASHEAVNEGTEEMAVMVYAGVLPIPERLTD